MDIGCALTSTVCVLAALHEREVTGRGQYVEVPQVGAALMAMSDVRIVDGVAHESFELDPAQRGHAATNALYQTADGWILVACYANEEWDGVRVALGIDESIWTAYPVARGERLDRSRTARAIERRLATMSTVEALQRFELAGVPCTVPAPYPEDRQLLADPQLRDLGLIVLEQHPDLGAVWEYGRGIRFANQTEPHLRPAPPLGQDTEAVLREVGIKGSDLDELVADGVVAVRPGSNGGPA
jgi:crotonobetainyl-CoA:carnitine CoA-transferase CaiB-like acyl-CoA transferase